MSITNGHPEEAVSAPILIIVVGIALALLFYMDFMNYKRFQFTKLLKKYYPEIAMMYPKQAYK